MGDPKSPPSVCHFFPGSPPLQMYTRAHHWKDYIVLLKRPLKSVFFSRFFIVEELIHTYSMFLVLTCVLFV